MSALDTAIRQGKALYGGISNYGGKQTEDALAACEKSGFYKPVIHQPYYNMFGRWIEQDLLPVTTKQGLGTIAFCPLAQGLLAGKYLKGIPENSRAKSKGGFLKPNDIKEGDLRKIRALNDIAESRGQTIAQMVLAWTVRPGGVTTALIGASSPDQVRENVLAMRKPGFTAGELSKIDAIVKE